MVKTQTFDAPNFWKNSYAHQRGKLLKKLNVTAVSYTHLTLPTNREV